MSLDISLILTRFIILDISRISLKQATFNNPYAFFMSYSSSYRETNILMRLILGFKNELQENCLYSVFFIDRVR